MGTVRESGRVVVIDDNGRMLLLRGEVRESPRCNSSCARVRFDVDLTVGQDRVAEALMLRAPSIEDKVS